MRMGTSGLDRFGSPVCCSCHFLRPIVEKPRKYFTQQKYSTFFFLYNSRQPTKNGATVGKMRNPVSTDRPSLQSSLNAISSMQAIFLENRK